MALAPGYRIVRYWTMLRHCQGDTTLYATQVLLRSPCTLSRVLVCGSPHPLSLADRTGACPHWGRHADCDVMAERPSNASRFAKR